MLAADKLITAVHHSTGYVLAGLCSYAARVEDVYRLQASDILEVVSEVSVGGRSEVTTQIYRKQERWRPRFTWSGGLFG